MPKPEREEAGPSSKYERQKMQRLYTQRGAAYGSVRNVVKSSNLPVSKLRQFLLLRTSYTKFTLATRKFEKMKAFASFENEISCMDLAYVDKLAKGNNGVKYPLVRQDLFDRTVDARRLTAKDSKKRAFSNMITKRINPRNFGSIKDGNCCRV